MRPGSSNRSKHGGRSNTPGTGERKGFGTDFTTTGMLLAAKIATRLDKKLHLPGVFAPEIVGRQAIGEYQLVLASTGPGPNQAGPVVGLGTGTFAAEPAAERSWSPVRS